MRYCFCVAGWYFYEDFFETLYAMPGDKYVVSHRPPEWLAERELPPGVRDDLLIFPNDGLDWGLYHQFNASVDLSAYDVVIYIHDDDVIKDPSFPEAIERRFEDTRVQVVGNGRNGKDWQFRFAKYRHCLFWEDDDDFLVRTVRGSFFAARTSVFEAIGGNFPVYWKASIAKQNKGNYSQRNFGYIVTKTFGLDAIAYLDDEHYLDTPYISELVRGDTTGGRARGPSRV